MASPPDTPPEPSLASLERRIEALEFVGAVGLGVAAMGALVALLRRGRVARFSTVVAERFTLVQGAGGGGLSFGRDRIVGSWHSAGDAAAAAKTRRTTEFRMLDGRVNLYSSSGRLAAQIATDGNGQGGLTIYDSTGKAVAQTIPAPLAEEPIKDAPQRSVPTTAAEQKEAPHDRLDSVRPTLSGRAPSGFV
jgi:hypothetical protein